MASLPGLRPRLQEMRWLLLSLYSLADAAGARNKTASATPQPAFLRCFILISLLAAPIAAASLEQRKIAAKPASWNDKVASRLASY